MNLFIAYSNQLKLNQFSNSAHSITFFIFPSSNRTVLVLQIHPLTGTEVLELLEPSTRISWID